MLLAVGCAASSAGGAGSIRTVAPVERAAGQLDRSWTNEQLGVAARSLQRAFARDGAEALLRLRLNAAEVGQLFVEDARRRMGRMPQGLGPTPGEGRWQMYRALGRGPTLGFCARGVRVADEHGADGVRGRALWVDRLLIVGGDGEGIWAAWIEGLILTDSGWRLVPVVPYERQVAAPRRDHTDVQLWDCDFAQRPPTAGTGPPPRATE